MAITLVNTPYPVMAAFNSCYYRMSSTNSGQVGFKYLIRATIDVAGVNFVQLYEITPLVGQDGYFDAQPITGLINTIKLRPTLYGGTIWTKEPISAVSVDFAESWTNMSPGPVYSVSHFFQVWGASKNTIDLYKVYPDYAYVWPGVGTPTQGVDASQMQNLITEKVYQDTSTYYSVWNYNSGNFKGIKIDVFNKQTNAFISTSTINNPFYNTGVYSNGFQLIDLGIRSLRLIVPSSGTSPILPGGYNYYYTLSFIWDTGGGSINRQIKRYEPQCDPVWPVVPIHWKSRLGAWETQIFSGKPSEILNKKSEDYEAFDRVPANELTTTSTISNPIYSRSLQRIRNIETNKILELNTLWLTEAEVLKCSDLFDSPQVYTSIVLGGSNYLSELRPVPNSYNINKRYNKKKFQINMSFRYSHSENRQV